MEGRQQDGNLSGWFAVQGLVESPHGFNRKGLVSEKGAKKLAFDVMRRFYEALDRKPAR